jgi:hypothetical protein
MGMYGGQYLGFMYAGKRSEDLGLIRVMQNCFNNTFAQTTKEVPIISDFPGVYFWNNKRNVNI